MTDGVIDTVPYNGYGGWGNLILTLPTASGTSQWAGATFTGGQVDMIFLYNRDDAYFSWVKPYEVWLGTSLNRFQQLCGLSDPPTTTTNALGPYVTYCPPTSYNVVTIKIHHIAGRFRVLAFTELEAYQY